MVSRRRASAFIIVATVFLVTACDAIELSKISVTLWPLDDGAVIASADPVWIEFSDDVRQEDAEAATSLKMFSGSVEYDVAWDGRRMTLTPTAGWRAGASYTLKCEGTVASTDGRSFDVGESVTFFAITADAPPVLLDQAPANDAIVSRKTTLSLTFSKPLDPLLIERYVTTSPSCILSVTLSEDGTILTIAPSGEWEGLTRYQWTVLKDLKGKDGVPIKEEYRGSFRVQEDATKPAMPVLTAVDPDDLSLELPLASIQKGSGILFRFTEAMNLESFKKELTITPDLSLTIREINDHSFVACRSDDAWDSGTEYTVTLGKGLSDANGNLTAEDFVWTFTPPYAPLTVVSIMNSPAGTDEVFEGAELLSTEPLPISVQSGIMDHTFVIEFSEPVSPAEAARLLEALTIKRVFPLSAANPDIVAVLPLGDNKVSVHVSGLTLPDDTANGERVLYKMTVKGGKTGFTLDEGNSLEKDFTLYMESLKL